MNSLIQKIMEVVGSLDTVARACKEFRSTTETTVEADSDFTE
jgi:hypothetical protein